ncbi:class F sortase [Micromonospora chalcea]|uniref:class F sortase n=1 Tax=Micromonospora chalcea TaxID=1874 RepID=UPI0021A7E75B|nr:class F sortase [Micromonospora chalcea]MCT2277790.1 class F sortase [Micromonospora chalcea]
MSRRVNGARPPKPTGSTVCYSSNNRWESVILALAGLLALIGASAAGVGMTRGIPSPPPSPAADAAPPPIGSEPTTALARAGLAAAAPTTITIDRIGVRAQILALGVNNDGTVQVPPLDKARDAGWYRWGPTPGQKGNAVITGHVDSAESGPAVFFRLGELRPGDRITISRAGGSAAVFRVDGVKSYPKAAFPTGLVYGPSDTAALRVITCGGTFDRKTGSYSDNVIAFGTLVAVAGK